MGMETGMVMVMGCMVMSVQIAIVMFLELL